MQYYNKTSRKLKIRLISYMGDTPESAVCELGSNEFEDTDFPTDKIEIEEVKNGKENIINN